MFLPMFSARHALAGCLLAAALTAPAFALAQQPASVLDLASQQKDLTTFVAAVHTAGLDDTLKVAGPVTVFAPTDQAFAKIPAADRAALLASPARLKALILGLVVNEAVLMHDGDTSVTSGFAPSAGGGRVTFGLDGEGRQTVDGIHVVRTDMRAGNGTITTLAAVPLS